MIFIGICGNITGKTQAFFGHFSVVQTSVPQNEAELQLYRVMQRASLLGYYDTLLEMGNY